MWVHFNMMLMTKTQKVRFIKETNNNYYKTNKKILKSIF